MFARSSTLAISIVYNRLEDIPELLFSMAAQESPIRREMLKELSFVIQNTLDKLWKKKERK